MANTIVFAQEAANGADDNSVKMDAVKEKIAAPKKREAQEKINLQLLTKEIGENNLEWLETTNGKFMALWQPDESSKTYGAVLLLHGNGQSVEWPHSVRALRKNLSLHGWATLSISLPLLPKKPIPPRPMPKKAIQADTASEKSKDKKTNQDDSAPQKEAKPLAVATDQRDAGAKPQTHSPALSPLSPLNSEQESAARLNAAVTFLNDKGQYNIVIVGHGVSATRAAIYIDGIEPGDAPARKDSEDRGQKVIRALIFVSARNHIASSNDDLINFINDPSLPILDIYFGDHILDYAETRKRKLIARKKKIAHFYQVKMLRPNDSNLENENRLTRRVRGFLNKHAKGVEIGLKK